MTDSKVVAGIKARYAFWQQRLSEATTEQDVSTATMSMTRIEAEAKEKGVDLTQAAQVAEVNEAAPGGRGAGDTHTQAPPAIPPPPTEAKSKKPKSVSEKEKVSERAAKIAQERAAGTTPGQTKPKGQPKPKQEVKLRPCLDGCGTMVTGNFKMGHDAKLKSLILKVERGEENMTSIPDIASGLVAFRKGEKESIKDSKGNVKSTVQLYQVVKAPVKFHGRPEVQLTKREE